MILHLTVYSLDLLLPTLHGGQIGTERTPAPQPACALPLDSSVITRHVPRGSWNLDGNSTVWWDPWDDKVRMR